jgi:hypothetical protein
VNASGTLNLNNNSISIGALSGAGNVTLGTGTLTFGNASNTTFSGVYRTTITDDYGVQWLVAVASYATIWTAYGTVDELMEYGTEGWHGNTRIDSGVAGSYPYLHLDADRTGYIMAGYQSDFYTSIVRVFEITYEFSTSYIG